MDEKIFFVNRIGVARLSDAMTVWERVRGQLIVSCQATADMPLGVPAILVAMAETVLRGGACAVRMEGPDTLVLARRRLPADVPVIGLWKRGDPPGVYITPTLAAVDAVLASGADVVALDATARPRPDGRRLAELVARVHEAGRQVLGDIASVEDGEYAEQAGADAVATTLYGYTADTAPNDHPNFALITELASRLHIPVLAEGHIWTPDEARRAVEAGAHAVIVGSAITRPELITRRFVDALMPEATVARVRLEEEEP
jgi:N-acylglucosamine-6-phosphate 2-epimerase